MPMVWLCLDMNNLYSDELFKQVKLRGSVQNKGWILENIDYKDASVPEELGTRGFRITKIEQLEKNYTQAGEFCFEP